MIIRCLASVTIYNIWYWHEDSEVYAQLAGAFDYENTYYHKAPKLDITNLSDSHIEILILSLAVTFLNILRGLCISHFLM